MHQPVDESRTRELVARIKANLTKRIAENAEPTDEDISDLLELVGGMAINLAIIANNVDSIDTRFAAAEG